MAYRSVALLRAVNVGGNNKVLMADLRALFETLGHTGVATYVQSGNLVFTSKRAPNATKLEDAFEERFGFRSAFVLRDRDELASLTARNPFLRGEVDHAKLHVIFAQAIGTMTIKESPPDRYHVDGHEAFVHYANGAGKTKLRVDFGTPSTARNWRIVLALQDMLGAPV
ncbi:MAG TPA: DUF1697 domain-containing protein [Kofleriaceae bacterium]|nr:DUF1697 domain-containing protein [Kofleriaceae bacterium]